jgi:hypothetical protein
VTRQGYTGTGAGHAGQGTIRLSTDGTTTYSLTSFDDGGVRLPAAAHTYVVDGASPGLTADFKPTVIAQTTPVVPLATDGVVVAAAVNDRESPISGVVLNYNLNGAAQSPVTVTQTGGVYQERSRRSRTARASTTPSPRRPARKRRPMRLAISPASRRYRRSTP